MERTAARVEDLSCPACLGVGRPLGVVVQRSYRLVRCPACGTQFCRPDTALPPPTKGAEGEYWEDYKFELYGNPAVQRGFEARYDGVLELARRHVDPLESVLDIGCGVGNFLDFAQRRGLRSVGSDVDPAAVEAARQRGLTAYTAPDLDEHVPDGSVDALSMWDVVEHLLDPHAVLAALVPKVRPGGALLFETPDAGFPARTVLLGLHRASRGRIDLTAPMYYWEHKVYFTERGLRRLLNRVGVDVVAVRRETSQREKMTGQFEHNAQDGRWLGRFLRTAWPALESTTRTLGMGNKLLLVGRRRTGSPDTAGPGRRGA